jgi:hypothetical protein
VILASSPGPETGPGLPRFERGSTGLVPFGLGTGR